MKRALLVAKAFGLTLLGLLIFVLVLLLIVPLVVLVVAYGLGVCMVDFYHQLPAIMKADREQAEAGEAIAGRDRLEVHSQDEQPGVS